MTIGDKIDEQLARVKAYGPYGVCLAMCALGFAMFKFVGKEDGAALVMRWIGVAASFIGVLAFALWHFFRWPPHFGDLTKST
ncbi:MAG: hypothetical protein AB7S70_08965 [Hyphomicrobium sp.]|uniref:hypothetical protein n=1 Tax=Hyphomicrobium sp. TaxID=82 RepID=UPI003D0A24A4